MLVFKEKRKNGWSEYYFVKFTYNKKQVKKCTYQSTKKEAEKWAKEYVETLKGEESAVELSRKLQKISSNKNPIRLEDAFEIFKNSPKSRATSDKQYAFHLSRWSDFLSFLRKKYPNVSDLIDITHEIAEDYIAYIRKYGKFNKIITSDRAKPYTTSVSELSNNGCDKYLGTMKMVFKHTFKRAGLLDNPFGHIPKLGDGDKQERDIFTKEELEIIYANRNDEIHPLVILALNTGVRLGDACLMKQKSFDFKEGMIEFTSQKTGKTVRIPMLPQLREFTQSLINGEEFLLPTHARKYMIHNKMITAEESGRSYSKAFVDYLNNIGIQTSRKVKGRSKRVNFKGIHSLRHTFIFNACEQNIPIHTVRDIVGHHDESVTAIYARHSSDESKKKHLANLKPLYGYNPNSKAPVEQNQDLSELSSIDLLKGFQMVRLSKELYESLMDDCILHNVKPCDIVEEAIMEKLANRKIRIYSKEELKRPRGKGSIYLTNKKCNKGKGTGYILRLGLNKKIFEFRLKSVLLEDLHREANLICDNPLDFDFNLYKGKK